MEFFQSKEWLSLNETHSPILVYGDFSVYNILPDECNSIDVLITELVKSQDLATSLNFLSTTPFLSKNKYLILINAHKWPKEMSVHLLKILEDIPKYCKIIIFSASQLSKTIESRCYILRKKTDTKQNQANEEISLLSKLFSSDQLNWIKIEKHCEKFAFETYPYLFQYISKSLISQLQTLEYESICFSYNLWHKLIEIRKWYYSTKITSAEAVSLTINIVQQSNLLG